MALKHLYSSVAILSIFLTLNPIVFYAQQKHIDSPRSFKSLSVDDGLSQSYITKISRELRPFYSNWDIYYVSGGVWGIIKDQKITTGLEVGIAPKTQIRQLINFDDIDSPDYPLLGDPTMSAVASQLSIQLYLGIEINFVKRKQ